MLCTHEVIGSTPIFSTTPPKLSRLPKFLRRQKRRRRKFFDILRDICFLSYVNKESFLERMVDALALRGDEGRDKLR
jgi:hypothetical protein